MNNLLNPQVGGAFIYSANAEELANWYKTHLCIDYHKASSSGAFFASFYYKDEDKSKTPTFAWSIVKSKYMTRDEDDEPFRVNYKVTDLQKAIDHLTSMGITVKPIEKNNTANYIRIFDPEGNHIEIWEEFK